MMCRRCLYYISHPPAQISNKVSLSCHLHVVRMSSAYHTHETSVPRLFQVKQQRTALLIKKVLQEGGIPKISVACISCTSCQQTRPISSSRQHRISTQVGMQHHIYLLSLLIMSFYILTKLLLCYMFSKGHVMLT